MNNKEKTGKREKISKAQQLTMLEVLGASLVLGTCLVLSIFMIKYIKFNTVIITEKNEAITEYDKTLRNVGVCADGDNNGRLSDQELENCKPNETALNDVKNSLRYNVLVTMAQNEDLESVARQRAESCYDESGDKIDFNKLYELSDDEMGREQYMQMSKICSALRVVGDALPAQKNTEALMASLDQIFILTGTEPERLVPRDDTIYSLIDGVEVIPTTVRMEGEDWIVMSVLNNIEKSIREFDITSANVEWTNRGISINAQANSYYLGEMVDIETNEVLRASKKTGSNK